MLDLRVYVGPIQGFKELYDVELFFPFFPCVSMNLFLKCIHILILTPIHWPPLLYEAQYQVPVRHGKNSIQRTSIAESIGHNRHSIHTSNLADRNHSLALTA